MSNPINLTELSRNCTHFSREFHENQFVKNYPFVATMHVEISVFHFYK
jgi:hypothetical protein